MSQITDKSFGPLVAYLLPGFFSLLALSPYSPELSSWLGAPVDDSPTVGGFLYATLASFAVGMTISAVRWLLLDSLHHWTGIPKPDLDFSRLQRNLAAFQGAVENHYRFYQFYGNMLVATLIATACSPSFGMLANRPTTLQTAIIATLVVVFYLASRDALRKYYSRSSAVLGLVQLSREASAMTNGWHPEANDRSSRTAARAVAARDADSAPDEGRPTQQALGSQGGAAADNRTAPETATRDSSSEPGADAT